MSNNSYVCSKNTSITFSTVYNDMIINIQNYKNPFNNIYREITRIDAKNIIFYNIDPYNKFISDPIKEYTWDNIPVYIKQYPELIGMINENNYYKKFYISNTNIDIKSNATKAYSINCGEYLLTPTTTPATEDHIVVLGLNRCDSKIFYYTAYDFYLTDKL